MQVADFDHNAFAQSAQQEQDKYLLVKFYLHPVLDKVATKAEGRPIYKEVEYIKINAPGSREGFAGPARPRDYQRFPEHYAAFKKRVDMPIEGTPLTEWAPVSRSLAEEMSFFSIKTVEQLANVSDTEVMKFRGGQGLKQKAKDWLEQSKRGATVSELQKALKSRDDVLDKMMARISELETKLEGE